MFRTVRLMYAHSKYTMLCLSLCFEITGLDYLHLSRKNKDIKNY